MTKVKRGISFVAVAALLLALLACLPLTTAKAEGAVPNVTAVYIGSEGGNNTVTVTEGVGGYMQGPATFFVEGDINIHNGSAYFTNVDNPAFGFGVRINQALSNPSKVIFGNPEISRYMPNGTYELTFLGVNSSHESGFGERHAYGESYGVVYDPLPVSAAYVLDIQGEKDTTAPQFVGIDPGAKTMWTVAELLTVDPNGLWEGAYTHLEIPLIVSDDLSGMSNAAVTITNLDGTIPAFALEEYFMDGENNTGQVTAVTNWMYTPEYPPIVDTYRISTITLVDRVGNNVVLTEANGGLDAATLAWRLSIVNELPPPPAVVDVNLTNDANLAANLAALSPVEGQTIRVQLDTSTGSVIPADAFAAIAGRNIELVIGNADLSVAFNGNDVTGTPKDVDTTVMLAPTATEVGFDGENAAVASFPDNGELPGKMTLRVSQTLLQNVLNNDGIGNVDFYFRNGETNELLHENVPPVEGIYSFSLTHHSDYIIAATRYVAPQTENTATAGAPQTGDASNLPLWVALGTTALSVLVVLALKRKQQKAK